MEISLTDRLNAFLSLYEGKPVTWGVDDCSACPALWVREATGRRVDYPTYRTEGEALALKHANGGLVPIWSDRLGRIGIFERFTDPACGDVAIIETRLWGEIGGIVLSGGVMAIRKHGPDGVGGWHPLRPRQFARVWAIT